MGVLVLTCPQCGAPVSSLEKRCHYCNSYFFIKNFSCDKIRAYIGHCDKFIAQNKNNSSNVFEDSFSLGLCYLQIKNYSLAQDCFNRAISLSPNNPYSYYYYVLSRIGGRRLKTLRFDEVSEMESFLKTAVQLAPDIPYFELLLYMLKIDYYKVNGLRVSEDELKQLLNHLVEKEFNNFELNTLMEYAKTKNIDVWKYLKVMHN